ncbi:FeoA family protein [Megamonas funiformis]|uniref:FeoA family protein n=1 Tax=Megamonas funiformis TaxID=437897 RepID=UPI001873A7FD|nr:FeoA domain-containing protein [Megamonas funiformis]MBE5061203.1 FeoA domain-containing protein [Megamonas funiformis]
MNVSQAQKGRTYLVKKVNLEGNIERRLEMLGMTDKVKLMVLNKKNQGAVIIKVRGTRFAIGKEIADAIEIEEIENE